MSIVYVVKKTSPHLQITPEIKSVFCLRMIMSKTKNL